MIVRNLTVLIMWHGKCGDTSVMECGM